MEEVGERRMGRNKSLWWALKRDREGNWKGALQKKESCEVEREERNDGSKSSSFRGYKGWMYI